MKVSLFGSTGLVGHQLLELLDKETQVTSIENVVRRSLAKKNPKIHEYIWNQAELPTQIFQTETLFCCLGTTIKKAGTQAYFYPHL